MRASTLFFVICLASSNAGTITQRHPKQLGDLLGFGAINVVKFPNDLCGVAPLFGTCYTEGECEQRGGVAQGSCASGFGICCIFNLECGAETAENTTFISQAAKTTFNSEDQTCTYKICSMNPNVARIRFDFTSFVISAPFTGITTLAITVARLNRGGNIGDCIGDSFQITSPGNVASPVICGFNTGQHMIVDASGACVTAVFNFDTTDQATAREYRMEARQFILGDDMGGPLECLQYFTSLTGTVSSFNFPTNIQTVPATTTHLSSQNYNICFRRATGRCGICFVPAVTIIIAANNDAITQTSFGLGKSSNAAAANSLAEAKCHTDFLVIPGGMDFVTANTNGMANTQIDGLERYCGRVFTSNAASSGVAATRSVCSTRTPFRVFFRTDGNELEFDTQMAVAAQAAMQTAITNEEIAFPGGIIGFSLDFTQPIMC